MHTDHAARVFSRGASFRPEAWCVSSEAIRQSVFLEDFAHYIVGERNFSGRDQPTRRKHTIVEISRRYLEAPLFAFLPDIGTPKHFGVRFIFDKAARKEQI